MPLKQKQKNLRRNLKALTQLHCIKLTAGYIFVKETIMRLRKFVFYIPGILFKKSKYNFIKITKQFNDFDTCIKSAECRNSYQI